MLDWRAVGKRLREVRERLGMTQDAVATHMGVTRPVISNVENGRRPLNLAELEELSALYGYPSEYFLKSSTEADAIAALFRSKGLAEPDRLKLAWLHGFLGDFAAIQERLGAPE